MREELLEKIVEVALLYLKLPENYGGCLDVWTGRKEPSNPVLNAVIFREDLWKKIKELSQEIHSL